MSKQSSIQKHSIAFADKTIVEVIEEDLQLVTGGRMGSPRPGLVRQPDGLYLAPSRNNPTAGDLYDKYGRHVGISIGNCSAGPC
jgi:hypothetical protein